jgi:hypothetical protein
MRLRHPPDGSTSLKYKFLCFITTKKNCKEKNTLAFNRDRCCHLVLCLRLIPFHWNSEITFYSGSFPFSSNIHLSVVHFFNKNENLTAMSD